MGCDIHMIVQIEREYDDGKTWWRTIYPPAWWPRDEYEQRSIHEYSSQLPDGEAARELAHVA